MSKQHIFRASVRSGLLIAVISILISCGGGSSGSGTATQSDLSVSHTKAAPGTFITIEDDSIQDETDLDVTFSNPSGFNVELKSLFTENGSAKVPLPLYINMNTGDVESGDMTVSIPNGKQATVQVEALPELPDIEAGSIFKIYLQVLVDNFNMLIAKLDNFKTTYGYDTDGLKAQMQIQIDEIESSLYELETTGTLSTYSPNFGASPLSQSELKEIDKLLYVMSEGIYDEVNSESLPVQAVSLALKGESPGPFQQWINNTFTLPALIANIPKDIRKQQIIINGNSAALKALLKRNDGGTGAGEYVFNRTAKPTKEFVQKVVIGTSQTTANMSEFVDTGENPGLGLIDEDLGDAAWIIYEEGIETEKLKNARNWHTKLRGLAKWIGQNICTDDIIDVGDYRIYCSNKWPEQVRNLYSYSNVVYLRAIESTTIISGGLAKISFTIAEKLPGSANFAKNNEITIDWRDGYKDTFTWGESANNSAFGNGSAKHPYFVPTGEDNKTYELSVSVKGDNEPGYTHVRYMNIKVISSVDPLTIKRTGPATLDVNEPGIWRFETEGGWGPYKGVIDWGDGSPIRDGVAEYGIFKGSHAYKKAGQPTIKLTVTDVDRRSVTERFSVQVGNAVENNTPSETIYVAWLHVDDRTCCAGDFDGVAPYQFNGTIEEQVKQGAIILKSFNSRDVMDQWVCNRTVRKASNWIKNWTEIDGYIVSNVPCDPNADFLGNPL